MSSPRRIKLAFLTTENREHCKKYDLLQPWFGMAPEALLDGLARWPDDIDVHVVSCTRKPLNSPEKIASNIWYHSVLVSDNGWLRTGYQGCIRASRRKVQELQPDLVHGQGTERDCALSAILSGFPNVVTIHGNMRLIAKLNGARPFSYQWITAHLERLTLPRTDGVVCITRYTQDAVRSLAKRTWLVPNAVDPLFFEVKPAPVSPPTILCVGAVTYRKNQNALIRALDPLAAKHSFRVLFLGSAAEGVPFCEEFFGLLKTRPWCVFGGFCDRERLRQEFSKATALVLPSLEDNCPMVVLEAMAAGLPALAPNVGGVPDLVEDNVNGLLCNPLEEASLRDGIERLLTNADLRQRLATRAGEDARKRFHPRVIAGRHIEIYRELLAAM